jgi:transposase InsO family protein
MALPLLHRRVIRAYTSPGHPIAFSAPGAVARHFNITTEKARDILEHEEAYTYHREYKQPRVYNPHYVHRRREQIQGDLIDIREFAPLNDGVQYLLLLIDVFTKKMWVAPMRNKSGLESAYVFRVWLQSLNRTPEILRTDNGKEFSARAVQRVLQEYRVEWQIARGTSKAAVAERANKTLQILIYKYMTHNETFEYLPKLKNLVTTYNERPHHTLELKFSPNEADKVENQPDVHAIHIRRWEKLKKKNRRKKPRFKIGDVVRIKIEPKKLDRNRRAYVKQFKGEHFIVQRVNNRMAVTMYYIRSLDDNEVIEGGFYGEELQRIKGDTFKIEDVVAERGTGRNKQYLVKWAHYGVSHNSWISASQVDRVYTGRRTLQS